MEKTGAYWLAKRSRGRVLLLEMVGKEKEGVGGKRYSQRDEDTCSTVMGLRFFLHMGWCFFAFDSEVWICVFRIKGSEGE
jgi:hypothetical protein